MPSSPVRINGIGLGPVSIFGRIIPETEIYEKTHIQIAIRNLNCIKGIFMPRDEIKFPVKR